MLPMSSVCRVTYLAGRTMGPVRIRGPALRAQPTVTPSVESARDREAASSPIALYSQHARAHRDSTATVTSMSHTPSRLTHERHDTIPKP